MKKIILLGVIIAVGVLVAIILMRDRFGMKMFSRTNQQNNDLIIVNDSPDIISVEYKKEGIDVSPTVQPGDQVTGGQGFIRVFTAKKVGSYELTYAFPRSTAPAQVTLSQIVESVKKENFGDEVITKKGMIGDIKVEYEEARDLDATY
jgi:hypothetical protein